MRTREIGVKGNGGLRLGCGGNHRLDQSRRGEQIKSTGQWGLKDDRDMGVEWKKLEVLLGKAIAE